jgi:hypothetical protein
MPEEEFESFLKNANEELRGKQQALIEHYKLGAHGRWWFEQATAKLQFFDEANNLTIEAEIVKIGSYSPTTTTWKWAWGNSSVLPELRKKAESLKELELITGLEIFGNEHAFEIPDERMAWELAAISVKQLGALACYRPPSSTGGPTTFLAIISIREAG